MISIKNNVLNKIAMSAEATETERQMKYKHKNWELLLTSIETSKPRNAMYDQLEKKMHEKLSKYDNISTLAEIKTKVFSTECQRFSLAMKGLKLQGIEAVASLQDKKISFLKDGVFLSTHKWITGTLLKKI